MGVDVYVIKKVHLSAQNCIRMQKGYYMDKNIIFDSFISMNEKQLEILNQAIEITKTNIAYFKGCINSKSNINNALISQGEDMKFQGKTIFKNTKCNTWYTRYRNNGKQYYISGRTQKEVLATLKQKLNYVKKEKIKYTTLLDWYNQWLKLFKIGKVKNTTLVDYKKSIKHIPSSILNQNIQTITSLQINNLINSIEHTRAQQKLFELLKALFNKAKDYEVISKNIIDIIEKPKHTKEQGIALTEEEQQKFIMSNIQHKDLFLITLYQGLRIGETLALTGKDIDIKNMKLTINKSINDKGQEDTTKNTQSNRIMPIFKSSLDILCKYVNYADNRIFNFTYSIPQKILKKTTKSINIRDISLHDLRHTFITNCKNKGIPEHIIQNWVGHRIGSNVTSKVYTHINEQDTAKYIDILDK